MSYAQDNINVQEECVEYLNLPQSAPKREPPPTPVTQPKSQMMIEPQNGNMAFQLPPANPGYAPYMCTGQPMQGYFAPPPVSYIPSSQQQSSNNNTNIVINQQHQESSNQQQQTVIAYEDHLIISIFATICCFLPTGLFAILKSLDARSARDRNDLMEASEASRTAWRLVIASMTIVYIILALCMLIFLIVGFLPYMSCSNPNHYC